MICDVCGKDRECPTIIVLTDALKATIRESGLDPPDEYHYCNPCWRVVCHRERGAQLLKGLFQATLTSWGFTNVDKAGERLHAFLLEKAKKNPVA